MINLFIVDPESTATKTTNMVAPGRKIALIKTATQLAEPTMLENAARDLSIFQVRTYGT